MGNFPGSVDTFKSTQDITQRNSDIADAVISLEKANSVVSAQTLASGAQTLAIDMNVASTYFIKADIHAQTLTISAPLNPISGQRLTVSFDNTPSDGTLTFTWNAVFAKGTTTVVATLATNKIETLVFVYNGITSKWQQVSDTGAN